MMKYLEPNDHKAPHVEICETNLEQYLLKKNWNFDYVYEETAVIENKWAKSSTKEARKMGINTKNQERNSKVKDKSQGNVE